MFTIFASRTNNDFIIIFNNIFTGLKDVSPLVSVLKIRQHMLCSRKTFLKFL